MKKETVVRADWSLVWREWSTRFWALALFVGGLNETQPELVRQIMVGLPPEYVNGFMGVLALAGLTAKFAPQPRLRQQRQAKLTEAERNGVIKR